MSNIEYQTPAEITKAAQTHDNPTQNVVADMMQKSPSEVANTIKQIQGDSGQGTSSLPNLKIDGVAKGQGCGGNEHGGGCSSDASVGGRAGGGGSSSSDGKAGGGSSSSDGKAGGGSSSHPGDWSASSYGNQMGGAHAVSDVAVSVPPPTARVTHH